ncbi:MAG: SUMF1/EgtB/PvdO family nonheme iron enzyme [Planctomycetia bacterium]|nr:SUMF1/EgtB/PvdO family nonheme iron enzyme [Planctomycetia bacterium]
MNTNTKIEQLLNQWRLSCLNNSTLRDRLLIVRELHEVAGTASEWKDDLLAHEEQRALEIDMSLERLSADKTILNELDAELQMFHETPQICDTRARLSALSLNSGFKTTVAKNTCFTAHEDDSDLTFFPTQKDYFLLCHPGTFFMGDTMSPSLVVRKFACGKEKWFCDAHPRHRVTLSHPFYLARKLVTVAEFRRFTVMTGYKTTAEQTGISFGMKTDGSMGTVEGRNWANPGPGFEQTEANPVVHVSHEDALHFIEWLNAEAHLLPWLRGYRYSLPTEAQWEYACRAGTSTDFFWGNDTKDGKGKLNSRGREWTSNAEEQVPGCFPFDDGWKATSPVGSFSPNPWGLFDMLGNVWEWCSDWYDKGYYSVSPATDPQGPCHGTARVTRGGSFYHPVACTRVAMRSSCKPRQSCEYIGFRLALQSEQQ